jgi:hypothetical protein
MSRRNSLSRRPSPHAPALAAAGRRHRARMTSHAACFPCVHAAATVPAQRLDVWFRSVTQPCQPSPKGSSGRPAHRPFRDCSAFTFVAACTLALSPIRDTHSECFSQFVTSLAAPVASGWSGRRVGLRTHWKVRFVTAHTHSGHSGSRRNSRIRQTLQPLAPELGWSQC